MNSDDVDRVEQAIIEAIREVGVEQHGTDLTLPTRAMAEAAVEVMAEHVRSQMQRAEKAEATAQRVLGKDPIEVHPVGTVDHLTWRLETAEAEATALREALTRILEKAGGLAGQSSPLRIARWGEEAEAIARAALAGKQGATTEQPPSVCECGHGGEQHMPERPTDGDVPGTLATCSACLETAMVAYHARKPSAVLFEKSRHTFKAGKQGEQS